MIVPMKKVYLILVDSAREESLRRLKKLGVVHLEGISGTGEALDTLREKREAAGRALIAVGDVNVEAPLTADNPEETVAGINELLRSRKELADRTAHLLKEEEAIADWGNFEPDDIRLLHDADVEFSLVTVPKKVAPELEKRPGAFCIDDSTPIYRYALVNDDGENLPAEAQVFPLPQRSLEATRAEIERLRTELAEIEEKLTAQAVYRESIEAYARNLDEDIRFEEVRSGVGRADELVYLQGFVPVTRIDELKAAAAEEGWGTMTTDPAPEDEVPTLLQSGRIGGLLHPLLNMLNITPGYRESDVSVIFLLFFTVFTGMLIGDAGYGLLFLALSIFGMYKSSRQSGAVNSALVLFLLLSFFTTVWGALTGTWFGMVSAMKVDFLRTLRLGLFSAGEERTNHVLMFISFLLGMTQLSLANIQAFLRELPGLKALARLGWISVLATVYFFILNQVLGYAFPAAVMPFFYAGLALIFLFGQQEAGKSFLKGILDSLANLLQTFLDVVGSFANIMSYIRLFAVGLATLKVAETFNSMAGGMAQGPAIIAGIVIIILGHSLNILLALLSVLVHAVRLNVLEYSGQLGMEWSGFSYKPFGAERN